MMIVDPENLTLLVERAREAGCIALDTEFVWERTYYPGLGVVQIGFSETECYLVDVMAIPDLASLGSLLIDPQVVKILHDAQQDLTILRQATGAFPRNVFDTRCAAGFAGLSASISLRDLLHEIVGVELDKTECRTNWLQRPLSESQIAYALEDVRYLVTARQMLLTRARERGLEAWLAEELEGYDDFSLYEEKNPRAQFQRLKGTGRLGARELAVLRELAAWREEEARRKDRPRSHVVPDGALVDLARTKLRSLPELQSVKGLSEKAIQRYGPLILDAVEKGLALPPDECPKPLQRVANEKAVAARADEALALIKEKSLDRGIDPSLVASRNDVTSLLREGLAASPADHRLLRGWRRELAGGELLKGLEGIGLYT